MMCCFHVLTINMNQVNERMEWGGVVNEGEGWGE